VNQVLKKDSPILEIKNLATAFKGQKVLDKVNLQVKRDEVVGIVGESGGGKTTLLRSMLLLQKATSGSIHVFGQDLLQCSAKQLSAIQHRWGVLFQQSALFSSLTVMENVLFPLRTLTDLDHELQREIAYLKIALTGLPLEAANKYPSELSGGMQKRAALARAIALDPEILFLDEPTSGLDPHSAHDLDQLILDLRKTLNLTIIIVTHDLETLWMVADRVAFLGKCTILACKPMAELVDDEHPAIAEYFSGLRAQRINGIVDKERKAKIKDEDKDKE
jgi:phospholipid/cholesterol/gamma-HCH transport system ATP-binding protein